jgi:hypothetical protein
MRQKLIGHIGVDAGLCWIGDPCYVVSKDSSFSYDKWTDFLAEVLKEETNPKLKQFNYSSGNPGLGVCVTAGYGDGFYPVYATVINGVVHEVTVKFVQKTPQNNVVINGNKYKARFKHFRPNENTLEWWTIIDKLILEAEQRNQITVLPEKKSVRMAQAVTVCVLEDMDKRPVAVGHAFCSFRDQFSKRIGRDIALNRAMGEVE